MPLNLQDYVGFVVGDSGTAAANTAVALTYAAATGGQRHAVQQISASYSAAPTGGGIKIEDGTGNTVYQADITVAGPVVFTWPTPRAGSPNTALIVTLAAGGASVIGKLNVTHLEV